MRTIQLFLLIVLSITVQSQQTISSVQKEIVFRSVHVIPMDQERIIENQDVVVMNGVITAIGKTGKVNYSRGAFIIEAKGKYLMPGLAEMHAHVPPVNDIEPMKEVLLLFAVNGVTTIRGMLGHPLHLELRKKILQGEILGPHFITSGPSFNGTSVTSPEAAVEMVKQQKAAGYDFLKLHPGLTKEKFAAIVKTAREVNIPFAGHVSFDVGIDRAIEAGYASIDHMDGFVESLVPGIENMNEQQTGLFGMYLPDVVDESRIEGLMKKLHDKNIWVVPTQALAERWFTPDKDALSFSQDPEMIYVNKEQLKNWITNKENLMKNPKYQAGQVNRFIRLRRKLISECNKNGVGLLLGSDAPQVFNVPGFSIHHELAYLVRAGLTPYQALRTGTVNTGIFLRQPDLGTIKIGNVSDLLLLTANPLIDIRNTKKVDGVMLGSKWLSKEFIDETLKKIQSSK